MKAQDANGLDSGMEAYFSRLAVFITFHFRHDRLCYLADMLRILGHYPVKMMRIVVCTNTEGPNEIGKIANLGRLLLTGDKAISVQSFTSLQHPFHLTWSHKAPMAAAYDAPEAYTHFIYAEDDIGLSFANFAYYVRYTDALAAHGLIPGFTRYEYNHVAGDLYLSDYHHPINAAKEASIVVKNTTFIDSPYPYMATFILTRAQMAEYMASRSFDMVESEQVSGWWIAERAAMGLTWENVPSGFRSRVVIAVDDERRDPLPDALMHHIPNNYTNNYADRPEFVAGRIKVTDGFHGRRSS